MYFRELDNVHMVCIHCFMHNLSAKKYGECSLLFSCGWDNNVSAGRQSGWDAIIGMYKRECERRNKGNARMVPKLCEIHVLRDCWTKLNVLPAKIMQVCLHSYSHS